MSIFETISTKQKTKKRTIIGIPYGVSSPAQVCRPINDLFFQLFCSNDQVFYQKKRSRKARCGREFFIFSRLKESENV